LIERESSALYTISVRQVRVVVVVDRERAEQSFVHHLCQTVRVVVVVDRERESSALFTISVRQIRVVVVVDRERAEQSFARRRCNETYLVFRPAWSRGSRVYGGTDR